MNPADRACVNPASEALSELGRQIGIPALAFDKSGCCQLAFDQHWLVTLTYLPAPGRWYLSCPLAERHTALPPGTEHAMLRANFLGAGCAGACLSVAPDSRPSLHLQLAQSEASAQALLAGIETLLNQAEAWADRLQRGESNAIPNTTTLAGSEAPPAWLLNRV